MSCCIVVSWELIHIRRMGKITSTDTPLVSLYKNYTEILHQVNVNLILIFFLIFLLQTYTQRVFFLSKILSVVEPLHRQQFAVRGKLTSPNGNLSKNP